VAIVEISGVTLLVDPESAPLLDGAEVDYVHTDADYDGGITGLMKIAHADQVRGGKSVN